VPVLADGRHDLDAMAAAVTDRTKVVMVCTPNNPTGPAVTQTELDAFLTNEPGTHFLGHAHTLANFETAFYRSPLADSSSFEQWEAEGARDTATRANAHWKRALAEYEQPPLDDALAEELDEWIGRQKASFADSDV
jgi:trimethylamine:corrinoid methyltransferase-like protein